MRGFINLNKPAGISSARAVAMVKKALGLKQEKVGHAGTLDPLASGVLPIAIGRATRLFDYMLSKKKTYIAEFTFGYETSTLDSEGEIIFSGGQIPLETQILDKLKLFSGEIEQIPPIFSAKSVNGVRAYESARKGEKVDLKPCKVVIYDFKFLKREKDTFLFSITCGSGTYIRSLCRDLARSLGTYATMTKLTRVETGVFKIENSVELASVNETSILPCEIILNEIEKIDITAEQEKTLLNGKPLKISAKDGRYKAYCTDLVGLLDVKNGYAKMSVWLK